MISVAEIKRKAERLFPKAVEAWLRYDSGFFPHRIPADLSRSEGHADLIREVASLRDGSKESKGYGYSLEFEFSKSRKHGSNDFPSAIYIETLEDLLKLTSKTKEFANLEKSVGLIRQQFPELDPWIIEYWKEITQSSNDIEALIEVVKYLQSNPRPDCFARELPLAIPTKLIENHRSFLASWLDRVLPPKHIDFGCSTRDFYRRYGFRCSEEHFLVRVLDPRLQAEWNWPHEECSFPISYLSKLTANNLQVVIVENKVNLLTFPRIPSGIAIGGLGRGISRLAQLPWLSTSSILYWGDLDVDGFEILAMVRRYYPQTQSLFMDMATLEQFLDLVTPGNGRSPELPHELNDQEAKGFVQCRESNLRLEQEHIPQRSVVERISYLLSNGHP